MSLITAFNKVNSALQDVSEKSPTSSAVAADKNQLRHDLTTSTSADQVKSDLTQLAKDEAAKKPGMSADQFEKSVDSLMKSDGIGSSVAAGVNNFLQESVGGVVDPKSSSSINDLVNVMGSTDSGFLETGASSTGPSTSSMSFGKALGQDLEILLGGLGGPAAAYNKAGISTPSLVNPFKGH